MPTFDTAVAKYQNIVFFCDIHGIFLYVSDHIKRYSLTPQQVINTPLLSYVIDDDKPKVQEVLSGLKRGKKASCLFRVQNKNRETIWLECEAETGNIDEYGCGIYGVIREVSFRIQNMNILSLQRRLFTLILSRKLTITQVYNRALDVCVTASFLSYGALFSVNQTTGKLRLVAEKNNTSENISTNLSSFFLTPVEKYISQGVPYFTEKNNTISAMIPPQFLSAGLIPIVVENKVIACLFMLDSTRRMLSSVTQKILLSLAPIIGLAIIRILERTAYIQKNEQFVAVFSKIKEILFVTDKHGKLLRWNTTVKEKLSYDSSMLPQLTIYDLFLPEYFKTCTTLIESATKRQPIPVEMVLQRQDGSRVPALVVAYLWEWENEHGVLWIARDNSKMVRLQRELLSLRTQYEREIALHTEELTRSNLQLQQENLEYQKMHDDILSLQREVEIILSCVAEQISFINPDFSVKWTNNALLLSKNNTFHTCHFAFFKQAYPCKNCPIVQSFATGVPQETTLTTHAGKLLQIKGYPIKIDETVIGCVEIIRDITNEQAVEMVEERHREEMIQADKMISLGTIVSGVAHEINNPNNSIMLNTSVFQKAWKSIEPILIDFYKENPDIALGGMPFKKFQERIPFLFSGILDSSQRIKQIVEELKNFSRKDTGRFAEPVDVNAVVTAAQSLLNNLIKKSTKYFSCVCGDHLPLIRGRFNKIEQVVINLIQNACQSLENNEKKITVTTKYDMKKEQVIVSVADEGIGISCENLRYITEPFYTTKRAAGGTGLGLSVSAKVIEDHGGRLEFESTQGKGTIARVLLPISPELSQRGTGR